jgi:hypothetical protein
MRGVAALCLASLATGCATTRTGASASDPMAAYRECVNDLVLKERDKTSTSTKVDTPIATVESASETEEHRRSIAEATQSQIAQQCFALAKKRGAPAQAAPQGPSYAPTIVSAVGMGVGVVTAGASGALYLKSSSTVGSHCMAGTGACDSTGASAASAATTEAWVAYGGLALAATGLIVLLATLPSTPAPQHPTYPGPIRYTSSDGMIGVSF